MILDEIVLHNFGLYAERQAVTLTPTSRDQPIILFGGLNGHGKTTVLDALQLCLYGPLAQLSNRNGQSYKSYLSDSVHRGIKGGEAAVELAFRHTVGGEEARYRLRRSWRNSTSGCREYFEVHKNRRRNNLLAQNWSSQVEDFLPPTIASLFLFDGEHVKNYANQDSSAQLIGTAIRNLLGLDVVDQLEKDLQTYRRRKRKEDRQDSGRDQIEQFEAQLSCQRSRLADLKQEQETLLAMHIEPSRDRLRVIEEEYQRLGGGLYDRRLEIERNAEEGERVFDDCAARLRELVTDDLPLLLIQDLLEDVSRRDLAEQETRHSRVLAAVLAQRDKQLLKRMRQREIATKEVKDIATQLAADRRRHYEAGKQNTILNLQPDARGELGALIGSRLGGLKNKANSELERWMDSKEQVTHMRSLLGSVPEGDTIAAIVGRREKLIQDIAALTARYKQKQEEVERLQRQVERSEEALLRFLEAEAEAAVGRQDRSRILRHAARVQKTLGSFRRNVIQRHIRKIERFVLESYQQLLRKASLVTRIEIDPETFAVRLYDRQGIAISAERLSAGERQLLAIALLWGFAKTSGRPLPTAIDTPLGRLDTGHRKHLVDRYFPFVSHQVILFSTDEEIIGPHLDRLRPFIGRSYRLAYDDASGSTRIQNGYFDGAAVT